MTNQKPAPLFNADAFDKWLRASGRAWYRLTHAERRAAAEEYRAELAADARAVADGWMAPDPY